MNRETFEPLKNIGLCFSGGGYRATFFSLGALSYLSKIQLQGNTLLSNVRALSTVSGGTLTGVAYANAIKKGKTFDTLYREMYETFRPENDDLLERALNKLLDDKVWETTTKKRSLINSFALAYEDMEIFKGVFSELSSGKQNANDLHVCFNATEFSYGLAFRFQNSGDFGNFPLKGSQLNAIRGKVRLADAVASSSCFPLGFEPLIFPDDYFEDHENEQYKTLKALPDFINGVGVMDGGIVDNQGIGSMVLISRRLKDPLDTIIVNDVGSYNMVPWEQDDDAVKKGMSLRERAAALLKYLTFNWVYPFILSLGVIVLLLDPTLLSGILSPGSVKVIGGILVGVGTILTLLSLVGSLVSQFGVIWMRSLVKKQVPKILQDDLEKLQNLNINLVKRMLTERFTSAVKMIQDVFLKQIRRLNYDLLYSAEDLDNRRITSTVYELNGKQTIYREKDTSDKIPKPSKVLQGVALTASETPTTLWWDEQDKRKDRMDTLLATGQFTICFNLLDYLLKLKQEKDLVLSQEVKKDLGDLEKTLLKDWKEFNKKPLWMVKPEQ